jgi:hypothetical protein
MANIQKSVSSAFANTRDARIDYHVVEKGSASLITGIYDQTDPFTQGFYRKPDITEVGSSAKAGLIYGEVMITPYVRDVGVESSVNDAASILKTYRFITGEGQNSGIPVGPNGSPLENVYIRDANGIPQPVVDSAGKPSMGNIVLASALGAAITSAPKIWDAIKGTSTAKTPNVDPVTGKTIPSATEQAATKAAAQIPLGKLTDVNDSEKGDNYVLTYDAKSSMWVAKPINTAFSNAIGPTTVTGGSGGAGGAGGNGGAGGKGGDGGSAGGTVPEPTTCYPSTSFVEYPHPAPPQKSKYGMIRLPTLTNTANNEYTQQINVLGTNGLELHFFNNGCGKKAIWSVAAGDTVSCPPGGAVDCFIDPNKATVEKPATAGSSVIYYEAATASIKICLTANICGAEYLIYSATVNETALSKTSYTFTAPIIYWADTKIAALLAKYPGQVWNTANPNVKLYLSRTDVEGSEYDLYFEGYKRLIGDTYYKGVTPPITSIPGTNTPQPHPVVVKADDGKFPDNIPGGGGMGAPSCPEPAVIPGTLPTAGEPGTPGTSGGAGGTATPGSTGTIDVAPAPSLPSIEIYSPCARQYGTQTSPPAFDSVQLPALLLDSGIADPTVDVFYEVQVGLGTFALSGSIPGTVTATFGSQTMGLVGPQADVMTASSFIKLFPDNSSQGDIHYTITITNSEGSNAGDACLLVPSQIVISESQSSVAKVCIDASSTGGTGKVMVTFDNKTRDLTSGYVAYNTNPTITAAAMASNINANIAFANAYTPGSTNWLPLFVATASGDTVTITAPASRGAEFNGIELSTAVTSGFVFGNCVGTFLGGVTKTITDFLKVNPKWSALADILYGIAGNVLGAVALNMIMGDVGEEQLSVPADLAVDVVFLYRGRVISVPTEYNATARTGHPTSYATWGGTWKKEWTQNPAWIVYDFITNKKYGLGNEINLTSAQLQSLLEDLFLIGHYCDELVTTNGVTGVRFSTNTVIMDGTKLQILQQLCSVFFGSVVFHNGGIRIAYDRLNTTTKLLVNQANAGSFDKTLSSSKNFINKVRLSYIEPANFYTEEVVIAEDTVAVATYGERVADMISFGCTDVNQAMRYAEWILNTEIENSISISYTGGLDHYNLLPGDLVEFYDSNERNIRRAGRIVSQTGVYVILDTPIASVTGDYFSLTLANGAIHQTTIAAISGTNVTLTAAPPSAANPNATFISASASLGRRYYKVIKVDETSNSKFNITLQLYSTDKY